MILQRYLRINVEKRYRVQSESLLRIKMQGGGGGKRIFPNISAIPIRSQRVMHVIFSPLDILPAGKGSGSRRFAVALKRQGRNYHEQNTAYVTLPVAGDAREALPQHRRKECINWKFRTRCRSPRDARSRHEQRICLYETHARFAIS